MIKISCSSNDYPANLLNIKKPPINLYIEGNVELIHSIGIAVIGTRNPSNYGIKMCKLFTKELVKYGLTIISGMAKGIDSIAHKTCIKNGGNTIAVLPNGFNYIYPQENKNLFANIIKSGGTAVTEYLPTEKPDSNKFLERNRIVAGLSVGTLVIEAGYRSGTSVTARLTREVKKPVFCIPSSLENRHGITGNEIIKKGAKLVTCVEDIIEELSEYNLIKKEQLDASKLINPLFLDVYNQLSNIPKHIDEIANNLNLSIQEVSYKLMMLELEEYIIELPGKNFIRK